MCCLTSHWFPGSSSECTRKAWETRGRLMAGSHGEDVHRGSVRTWRPATITATTVGHRGHNSCLPSPTRVQLWERGHECREGNSTAKAQLGVSLPALGGGDSLSGTWGNSWVGNAAHSRPPAWEETVSKTYTPLHRGRRTDITASDTACRRPVGPGHAPQENMRGPWPYRDPIT